MTDFREGVLFASSPIHEQPRKSPSWIGLNFCNYSNELFWISFAICNVKQKYLTFKKNVYYFLSTFFNPVSLNELHTPWQKIDFWEQIYPERAFIVGNRTNKYYHRNQRIWIVKTPSVILLWQFFWDRLCRKSNFRKDNKRDIKICFRYKDHSLIRHCCFWWHWKRFHWTMRPNYRDFRLFR